MANLGKFTIDTNNEYEKLSEVTGLTLTEGTTYIIQNLSNTAFILCEGTNGGYPIFGGTRIPFTQDAADLYIKTSAGEVIINISD